MLRKEQAQQGTGSAGGTPEGGGKASLLETQQDQWQKEFQRLSCYLGLKDANENFLDSWKQLWEMEEKKK